MAQEHINLGTPNGQDGDYVRDAMGKTQSNFSELYSLVQFITGIANGSAVWVSGLTFDVIIDLFILNGEIHPAPNDEGIIETIIDTVTLSPADPTNPRIDLIVVNEDDTISVIEGTPAVDPSAPSIDYQTQIEITNVLILAGATTPSGVSEEIIYEENTGEPNEWTTTESTGGTRINLSANTDPYANSIHIKTTNLDDDDFIKFENDVDISGDTVSTLNFRIKNLTQSGNPQTVAFSIQAIITFLKDGALVSNSIYLRQNSFGYDSNDFTNYQHISIPSSIINFTSNLFDEIKIVFTNVTKDFHIDNVRLTLGVAQPPNYNNTFLGLDDVQDDTYTGKEGFLPVVVGNELVLTTPADIYDGWVTIDTEQTIIAKKTFTAAEGDDAIILNTNAGATNSSPSKGMIINATGGAGTSSGATGVSITATGGAGIGSVAKAIDIIATGGGSNSPLGLNITSTGGLTPKAIVTSVDAGGVGISSTATSISGGGTAIKAVATGTGSTAIHAEGGSQFYQENNGRPGLQIFGNDLNFAALKIQAINPNNPILGIDLADATLNEARADTITIVQENQQIDIGMTNGNYINIDGTGSISRLGGNTVSVSAGSKRTVNFVTSLTIKHNADIILPGGQDITVNPGDSMMFVKLDDYTFKCINYHKNIIEGSTPFEAIDEGNGIGIVKKDRDPANYGNIGLRAFDLSHSDAVSTERGSLGDYSITTGLNNINTGDYSIVHGTDNNINTPIGGANEIFGSFNLYNTWTFQTSTSGEYNTIGDPAANGNNSVVYYSRIIGARNNMYAGKGSLMVGVGLLSGSTGMTIGIANEDLTLNLPTQLTSSQNLNNPLLVVGNGSYNVDNNSPGAISRSNAFYVMKSGDAAFPSLTNAMIDSGPPTGAVTRDWIDTGVGADVATLQANQLDGIERYNTLADLQAVGTPSTTTRYAVTRDGSNNGYYSYNGTTFDYDGALSLESVNFIDFVTNSTDRNAILTQNNSQNEANNVTYWNDMITYVKANNVRKVIFPTGLYRFEQCIADDVDDLIIQGENAIIKWDIVTGGTATWRFTNCDRVEITGFTFGMDYASYQTVDYIEIGSNSGLFEIHGNIFYGIARSGIRVHSLTGGSSSDGVYIHNNIFRATTTYNEDDQTGVLLENDGEYCRVEHNRFYDMPSAARFVNGANGSFSFNNVLGAGGQQEDDLYTNALVYIDNTGTNAGKVDVLYNKFNHNNSGVTAIVVKGTGEMTKANKVIGNDILIHGNATKAKAIYLDNTPYTIVRDNKMQGFSTPNDEAITINNSEGVTLDSNIAINYTTFIEATGASTDIYVNNNNYEGVTNYITLGGTSTIAPTKIQNAPVYADDAAAATGGLVTGQVYQTATGAAMIKQ